MTDLLMIKRTTFKLCKNSRKNFLDEMTDLLMMKRTRFKCIKRGIRTSWTRWQICGLIYDDEENWILQCAKINMKDLGACLWGFDFVDVWNVIFFLFFWSCFFPFPPCLVAEQLISWPWPLTENTTLGQGKKFLSDDKADKNEIQSLTRTRFKMWWENKIQKCAKLTTRNLGPYDRLRDGHKVQTCSMQMYGTMLNTERTKSVPVVCDGE